MLMLKAIFTALAYINFTLLTLIDYLQVLVNFFQAFKAGITVTYRVLLN